MRKVASLMAVLIISLATMEPCEARTKSFRRSSLGHSSRSASYLTRGFRYGRGLPAVLVIAAIVGVTYYRRKLIHDKAKRDTEFLRETKL